MPRLIDRRTGRHLCTITEEEFVQLMSLFEEPVGEGPADEPLMPIDPDLLERLAESGASERVLMVAQQILQGREDFDLGWEPD